MLFLAGCFVVSIGVGQMQQKQDIFKILGISVEGQHAGDPASIIANTGLQVGEEITIPGEANPAGYPAFVQSAVVQRRANLYQSA